MVATMSWILPASLFALAGGALAQEGRRAVESPPAALRRIESAPLRGRTIPLNWSEEDAEEEEHRPSGQLGGQAYLDALEATGMTAYLARRGGGGSAESRAAAGTWTSTGPVGGFGGNGDNGRVAAVALAHYGVTDWVYAGASGGGLWRTDFSNLGVWQSLGDNLPNPAVRAFAPHPTDSQRIVVGTGDMWRYEGAGLFLTTDGGGIWTQVSPTPIPRHYYRVRHSLDDPSIMVAVSDNGLMRSTSTGSTWTRTYAGHWTDLVLHPTNSLVMYAVRQGGGVYKSTDKGASFNILTSANLPSTTDWGRSTLAICRDAPDTVGLLVEKNHNVFGIYRTTNGGTSWTNVTSNLGSGTFGGGQAHHCQALVFNPADPDEMYAASASIARSYWDSGQNKLMWAIGEGPAGVSLGHSDVTHLLYSPISGDSVLWIANDGGLYVHVHGTGTTQSVNGTTNGGLAISQVDHMDADRTMISIGLQDDGVLRTVTATPSWTRVAVADGGSVQIIDPEAFDIWFWGGMPWYPARLLYGGSIEYLPNPPVAAWFHHEPVADRVWAGGAQTIYSAGANDNPVVWTAESTGTSHPDPSHGIRTLWGSKLESGLLYLSYGYGLDGDVTVARKGSSWTFNTTQGLAPNGWVESVTPSSEWPGEAWLGCKANPGDTKIFHTTDFGANWTDVTANLLSVGIVHAVVPEPFRPTTAYAATDLGMYRTTDGGASWSPFQDGMPVVEVRELSFVVDDGFSGVHKLRAGTFGRGTWERDIVSSPVVYVDGSATGTEDGTYQHPFNTVAEGVNVAPGGSIVAIHGNIYSEPQVITRNVKLFAFYAGSLIH